MKEKNAAITALKRFVGEKAIFSDEAIETHSDQILECIRFIEHVVHDSVVVVCGRDRVSYVSTNCRAILGMDHTYLKSLSLMETLDIIHPDDLIPFKNCMDKLSKVIDAAYDQYKFVMHYRMKDQKGEFLFIRDEKMAVKITPGKFAFITLLRPLSSDEIFSGVKLTIQKRNKDKFITIDEFVPMSTARVLTPRQAEIVALVARGLSNKAIAERLSVSLSTIKNHKQNLFRKIHVKNSIQMLSSVQVSNRHRDH